MILYLAAAASAHAFLSPLRDDRTGAYFTKAQISKAAETCKTGVIFIPLAMGVIKTGSPIGYVIDPHVTEAQRRCVNAKVPSTRVGVIEMVPTDLSTSSKK